MKEEKWARESKFRELIWDGELDAVLEMLGDTPDDDWSVVAFEGARSAPELVHTLLDRGLPANVTRFGRSLLCEAAAGGQLELIRRLLSMGATVDAPQFLASAEPLPAAVYSGNVDVVRLLLEAGAPVDQASPGRQTALGVARSTKETEIEAQLLEHGAQAERLPRATLTELLEAYRADLLSAPRFDEELWERIARKNPGLYSLNEMGAVFALSWGSRMFEMEVLNGGLSQAAFNVPEWIPIAAMAYREFGLPDHARLTKRAHSLAKAHIDPSPRAGSIRRFMTAFRRALSNPVLDRVEEQLLALEHFPAEEPRLIYIFNHWASFLRAEPVLFS